MSLPDFTLGQIVLHIESGRTFVVKAVGLGIIEMAELFEPKSSGHPIHVPLTATGQFRPIGRTGR